MLDFSRDQNSNPLRPKSAKLREVLSKKSYFLYQQGDQYFKESRFKKAKESYRRSLEYYKAEGDTAGAGLTLTRLGRAEEIMGEYSQARRDYEASLALFQNLNDYQGIARSKAHLGNIGWATGDYQEAAKLLQDALNFYHAAQDKAGEAWVHDLMGNLRLAMRDGDSAERHYQTAYSLMGDLDKGPQVEAWNLYHMAAVDFFRAKSDRAKEGFQEALQCFTRVRDALGQVAVLVHLGEIACEQKKLAEAEGCLSKAVELVLSTECKPLLADALTGVAQLLRGKGEERKAIGLLMVTLSHPTCRQQTKDRMVSMSMSLQSSFSPTEARAGFEWAKSVSLEEMASGWLNSVASKAKPKKHA
jgi:tetratricopeptide (TPR) repeat protein